MKTLIMNSVLVASIVLLMPLAAFSAEFTDGLVLYFSFDEGKGDVAEDLSGNKHEGVIDNPIWAKGKFGQALQFDGDGSGTFVTVESTPKLNVNEMTFMAWVNAEHWNGTRQIAGKSVHGGCGGRVQFGLFSDGPNIMLRFETEAGRVDIVAPLPDAGKWAHIAVTNDGTDGIIYIDGKEEGKGAVPGKLGANADPFRIGQDCDSPQYVFAGLIDEPRLWDHALSEGEISDFKDLDAKQALAVDSQGKLSTAWGKIKTKY